MRAVRQGLLQGMGWSRFWSASELMRIHFIIPIPIINL